MERLLGYRLEGSLKAVSGFLLARLYSKNLQRRNKRDLKRTPALWSLRITAPYVCKVQACFREDVLLEGHECFQLGSISTSKSVTTCLTLLWSSKWAIATILEPVKSTLDPQVAQGAQYALMKEYG